MKDDGEQSILFILQFYSDKSVTSLKPCRWTFYPFHVTILNFLGEARRRLNTDGSTINAFLSTKYTQIDENPNDIPIQDAIDLVARPLSDVAKKCFTAENRDGVKWRCHTVLANYCDDLPEAKQLLPVRAGTQTALPWHRCLARKDEFPYWTKSLRRSLQHTNDIFEIFEAFMREARLNEGKCLAHCQYSRE